MPDASFAHSLPSQTYVSGREQLEALLAESRAGTEALRDDLRRLSLDYQHLQQEAQAAEARHAAALAGKEQEMRMAAQVAKVSGRSPPMELISWPPSCLSLPRNPHHHHHLPF